MWTCKVSWSQLFALQTIVGLGMFYIFTLMKNSEPLSDCTFSISYTSSAWSSFKSCLLLIYCRMALARCTILVASGVPTNTSCNMNMLFTRYIKLLVDLPSLVVSINLFLSTFSKILITRYCNSMLEASASSEVAPLIDWGTSWFPSCSNLCNILSFRKLISSLYP